MTIHTPDKWLVLKGEYRDKVVYKVFGSWGGGYLNGSSWRLNSGIVKAVPFGDDYIDFIGLSGSIYRCHKEMYGVVGSVMGVLNQPTVEVLDESTDWFNKDWTR